MIKKPFGLTQQDFGDALETLRVSVSEVAKETGIPRNYLSDFRNHGTPMRREYVAKLRDYCEQQGLEFEPAPAPTSARRVAPAASPDARVVAMQAMRRYLPIADAVSDEALARAMDVMDDADARLRTLLKMPATKPGFFEITDDEWNGATQAALDEANNILAAGYIVFRILRGFPALTSNPSIDEPKTVRDILLARSKDTLVKAGVIAAAEVEQPATEQQPEETEETDA